MGESGGTGRLRATTEDPREAEHGGREPLDRLITLNYDELERLAASFLQREYRRHLLQPEELVHEVFLRLARQRRVRWQGKEHVMALAATMMRRVLVERARRQTAAKRGGEQTPEALEELPVLPAAPLPSRADLRLGLRRGLRRLGKEEPELLGYLLLRYREGLSVRETARACGVSDRTVKRRCTEARAHLRSLMTPE